jgi:hypothetical protein
MGINIKDLGIRGIDMDKSEKVITAATTNAELPDVSRSSLKDVRAANSGGDGKTAGQAAAVLGETPQLVDHNAAGHSFHQDKNGGVTEFTYNDAGGKPERSFSEITRDATGNVNGFKDSDGNVWQKLDPDPTSVFEAERKGGWMYENENTGEFPRSPVDLGNVTIDQNGVHADGQNVDYLAIPKGD